MAENSIICRVCLRSDSKITEKCLSLFEKYKNGIISDTINSIANIGIREGDGLPSKICPDCLLELDTAVNFKSKCETSNGLLKSTALGDGNIPLEFTLDNIKKEEPSEDHFGDFIGVNDNEELFVDGLCPKLPVKRNNVKREKHEKTVLNSDQLKFKCHDCEESFKSKCKLQVHWKKTHMPEKLICQRCKRVFKTVKAYNKHTIDMNSPCLLMAKVRIEGIGKDRMFYCNECEYKSHRSKDMKRHLNSHTGVQPYQCTICHKSYTQRSTLNSHLEVAHKMFKTEITCQYCGKFLRGRTQVYSHLRMHRQIGVQCDICKKQIRTKKNLILHLKRHAGVKMYTCELCGSSHCTAWELTNHRRTIHERGQHIYKCDLCQYKTFRNETLYRHKKKHANHPTSICCLICGVFVSGPEALVQHQKRHQKKFHCPYCPSKYARKDSLQKHVKAKHEFTSSVTNYSKPIVVKTETPSGSFRESLIEVEVSHASD